MIKFKKGEFTNLICGHPVKMLITDTRHQDAMASVINEVNSISEDLSSSVELAAGGRRREGGKASITHGDEPRFASVYGGQPLMVVVVSDDFQRYSYGEGNCIPSQSAAMSLAYCRPPRHEYVFLQRRFDHLVFFQKLHFCFSIEWLS
jgi:hypothetical protein